MLKIKKLNKEIDDLKKVKLASTGINDSAQFEQYEQKIHELQKDLNKQLDTNKYQQKCMNEVDREN